MIRTFLFILHLVVLVTVNLVGHKRPFRLVGKRSEKSCADVKFQRVDKHDRIPKVSATVLQHDHTAGFGTSKLFEMLRVNLPACAPFVL